MIKLVSFDWNGTLFADTTALVKGVNVILKLFNHKPVTIQEYRNHFDVPVRRTYIGVGLSESQVDNNSKLIAETYHPIYEASAAKSRTRANSKKLLRWLEKEKISSIIFSNHIEDKIIMQLKRLKIERYFSTVLANYHIESSQKSRMKKEKLREYIKIKKLRPMDVLIIGDTIEEVEIGKELGCTTIAITNGSCSTSRLKSSKPDFLISNLSEVIGIINKLNN
ncbi:MAG TPA: HAD hydrolase-like protein [Candidatus Limnocylindrales bacterium]|nr:HAD hydrolase-like protein [Candidatus Limnocylindrales bacterium]